MGALYVLSKQGAVDEYPYSLNQLRSDNRDTSFPLEMPDDKLALWGVHRVVETARPEFDAVTQSLIEDKPIQIDGQWVQVWEVRAASAAEIAERKEKIRQKIVDKVQQRLDTFAQTRGYDNIVSACSYASSQHPKYGPEGRYCVAAREQTWDALFAIEAEVIAGTRPMPYGYDSIESDLPVLTWPT